MRPDSWITLALCVFAFAYFSLTFTSTLDLRDEGYLLARAAQVAEGAVPHRDFADVYGPGVFAATGAALSLGGGEILASRVLIALLKTLAVALGFAISRRFAPRWLALFVAVVGIAYWGRFSANLNAPYAALFTVPIALAATLALIRSLERGSLRTLVLAGGLAGLAVLFKQSLGLMLGYGMLVSAIAVAWLGLGERGRDVRGERDRAGRGAFAVAWLLAGAVVVVPVAAYLTPVDYLLHFLPVHAIFVVVLVLARSRPPPDPLRLLREVVGPFLCGMAIAPAATLLFYGIVGGQSRLVQDMFVLPLTLRNYTLPVVLPPPGLGVSALGAIALVVAGLLALAGRSKPALWLAAAGGVSLAIGLVALPGPAPAALLGRGPFGLEGVLAPFLLFAALALSGSRLVRGSRGVAGLPVLLVSSLLCFEVFPRAGHNLWILHGALTPLLALALAGLLRATGAGGGLLPRWRRVAAGALIAIVPSWLVAPLVSPVLLPDAQASTKRPLALPRARGLRLDARWIADQKLREVEGLIAWLAAAQPADAPLLLLTNEEMIRFLSGRPALFADHGYSLFLAGWGMLPAEQRRELDSPALLDRVRQTPDLLVIHRPDPTAANLRRALPRLRETIEKDFRVVARFGDYRVLRRAP